MQQLAALLNNKQLWPTLSFCCAHRCSGAADTEDEAHRRADALVQAGVVLRFNGIVYLKPQEVSELVYRVRTRSAKVEPHAGAARKGNPGHAYIRRRLVCGILCKVFS